MESNEFMKYIEYLYVTGQLEEKSQEELQEIADYYFLNKEENKDIITR